MAHFVLVSLEVSNGDTVRFMWFMRLVFNSTLENPRIRPRGLLLPLLCLPWLIGCQPTEPPVGSPRLHVTRLEAPTDLVAEDAPGDRGRVITLSWQASATENTPAFRLREEIQRRQAVSGGGNADAQERRRIRDEVVAAYDREPRILYRVQMRWPFRGLEAWRLALCRGEAEEARRLWLAFETRLWNDSGEDHLTRLQSLVRLARALAAPTANVEPRSGSSSRPVGDRLCDWLAELEALPVHGDALAARVRELALAAVSWSQHAHDRQSLDGFLARLAGELAGESSGKLSGSAKPIDQEEYALDRLARNAGLPEQTAFLRALVRTLVAEQRSGLSARERAALVVRQETASTAAARWQGAMRRSTADVARTLGEVTATSAVCRRLHERLEQHAGWEVVKTFPSGTHFERLDRNACEFRETGGDRHFVDVNDLVDGLPYEFRVDLTLGDQTVPVTTRALATAAKAGVPADADRAHVVTAISGPNWFAPARLNLLLVLVVLLGVILFFLHRARRNPRMFIRKIDGLNAVDRAVDKAAESGRPIYYLMGIGAVSDLPTIASFSVLERIARQAARRGLRIKVPCFDPVVMTVAQDVVREAFRAEGRLDRHREEDIFFVTSDQFSYAASVDGMLHRDRPAATFLLGHFQAESLLLSEVGSHIGSIQIAGTDTPAQLPFFVTTADYTLIGEELYAASAYLSRDALLLGSLRGQDVGKALIVLVIVVGVVLNIFHVDWLWRFFA